MKVFEFSTNNLRQDLQPVLYHEWQKVYRIDNNLFKFKLDQQIPTKYLAGKYSFIVQKNSRRYSEKRPTDIKNLSTIKPSFDEAKFNFTKISPKEVKF